MNETTDEKDIFDALILVLVGIVLLLNNFGVLPWNVWQILFKFWPLIIILWGVKIAFGKNSIFHLFSFLLIVLAFLYSIASVSPNFDKWIENQIPQWKDIKGKLPQQKLYQQNKTKVFRCDPITGECSFYYR